MLYYENCLILFITLLLNKCILCYYINSRVEVPITNYLNALAPNVEKYKAVLIFFM